MREVAVFCLDVDDSVVRITETMRFQARASRARMLDITLPLQRPRKTAAGRYREALRIATRHINAIIDRHLGKERGVAVLVDPAGQAAIEGRDQPGMMQLFRDMPLTVMLNHKASDNLWRKGGGLPFDLGERSSFRGFVTPDGTIRVLEFGCYNRGMVTSRDGWSIVPLDLRLECVTTATPEMMRILEEFPGGPVNAAHEACLALQRLFFSEVSPALKDPFVRQKPLYICGHETEQMQRAGYSQGPAKLKFRRGSQAELARLVRAAAILAVNGCWGQDYRNQLASWHHLTFKMMAAGHQRDARLLEAIFITLQPGLRNLLTVILELMSPKGMELGYSQRMRVSKAPKRPATFYCRVDEKDLESLTGHDEIEASAAIESFLTANGISADDAAQLIDDV